MAFVELSVTAHQSHNWGKVSILLFILFTERFMETQKLVFPSYVQISSVTQSCLTLCDPMDCGAPGFPVHHQLPELAQTHCSSSR